MIGKIVTDKEGYPISGNGQKLSESSYNPPEQVKKLFAQCQMDYGVAWRLQHRGFDEFDGYSLLERTRLDQQTFGAYVGIAQNGANNSWRWRGRKNTARNKVIGILAHIISGMLFPYCYAYNEEDEEDEMTAKVMRILIENHLRKADYEIKFLFMMTSALVNPAVFAEIEYVEAMQRIKVKKDGKWAVEEAVDTLLSGINLNIIPIDQMLLADFFTFDLQRQPYLVKVRRISYDEAREIYANKYFIDGVDQFNFVRAGTTRIVMAGQEHQTLYDIEWTEADANYVQELTFYYRPEDLEVTFVGGIFMGNHEDIYNSNGFKHRRMSMIGDKWMSIPVYPFVKSGFEPLDPAGRFAYYKSACFKEFWDDASQNRMYQMAHDGTMMDVFKPIIISGVAKMDSTWMVPGATVGVPQGATMNPYQLGPNLQAALRMMDVNKEDMSESTQDPIQSGITEKGVTAYAVSKAEQNAQMILGVFGQNIAKLVKDVGELVMDDIIVHETIGEVDATIPESLNMKYRALLVRGNEGGKDVTNKIQFSSQLTTLNSALTKEKAREKAKEMEWSMFEDAGGMESTQRNYLVDPYRFARHNFSVYIDPSVIINRSMGTDQLRKERAFNLLMDPRVAPFVNQEAVVDKFILEDYSDGDPDQFKKTEQQKQDFANQVMGNQQVPPQPAEVGVQ